MIQLNDNNYYRFRALLREHIGLEFGEKKRSDLATHLDAAMIKASVKDIDVYYSQLCAASLDDPLWAELVDRLTVGETYFLRNPAHFAALREHIFPDIIQRRRESGQLVLRIWSAGCATGEEPYSLAITLRKLLPDIDQWSIMILATDISRSSLAQAAEGLYKERSFRNDTPSDFRERYFKPIGGSFELLPHIRRMVHYAYLNLAEDNYPSTASFTLGLDLIVCRNVTIYFEQKTTSQIASRFKSSLVDGGYLLVGHSEPLGSIYVGFKARNFDGAIAYQKSSETATVNNELSPPHRNLPATNRSVSPTFQKAVALDYISTENAVAEDERRYQAQAIETQEFVESPLVLSAFSARDCFEKAKAFADQMQWSEAHQWLDHTTARAPLLAEAHFMRALVYQHQGEDKSAMQALRRVLYIDRDFVLGHFNIGMLYQRMGLNRQASRAWKTAQQLIEGMSLDEPLQHGDGITAGQLSSTLSMYLTNGALDET